LEQKKIYRTLENAIKHLPDFKDDHQLLSYVLKQIISNENININGGRIWTLNETRTAYIMLEQHGEIEKIRKGYTHKVSDYPIFYEMGRNRSVIAKETDKYLFEKGINLFAATGIGDRFKVKDKENREQLVYQYILAFNSPEININLLNTLNIVSTTVTSLLRSRRIERKARAIEKDLVKAQEIQKSILPEHEYNFGNYEVFGISIPDRIVGGDFFDYLISGSTERMGIAIGDAASKGFSAAAQALYVSGALKMGSENELKMTTVIKKINNLVYKIFPYERFVSLCYVELYNDSKGLCLFINAGHNPPFHFISETGEIRQLNATGPVIGPAPDQDYSLDSFYFKKDDIVLLYTDGIVEAANNKFEFFGDEKLKETLLSNKSFNAKEIAENVMEEVQKFSARGKYSDDKTIVAIKRVK